MTPKPASSRSLHWVLVLVALGLGATACGGDDDPAVVGAGGEHNQADISFAQGMIPHHSQAIEMADLVIEKGQRSDVKEVAERIRAAQAPEIATMRGWLRDWDAPQEGESEGMESSGNRGLMMSGAEMQEMIEMAGAELDTMFLRNMIRHHQGAIEMAQAEVDGGEFGPAKELARGIIDTQKAEITEMQALLDS